MYALPLLPLFACSLGIPEQSDECNTVPAAFEDYVTRTLSDSTDLFRGAYPMATPLSCELLDMVREELEVDSARYCFERLSRRFWDEDPHARITHAYIARHRSFALAIAAAAHWNEDHRILGLKALQEYRRIRPMVCTTKEGNDRLLRQDSAAVRYLLRVLETTPLRISGSENATIHSIYMREVMATLDLFTGQDHLTSEGADLRIHRSDASVQQAVKDWRKWLGE